MNEYDLRVNRGRDGLVRIIESGEPHVITRQGDPIAVLMPVEDYWNMVHALERAEAKSNA